MKWAEQGELLRRLRDARGLTGWDVAVAIGRRPQSVSNWETGKVRPPLEMVVKIGDLLDAKAELLAAYGYAGDQSLADRVREAERRLDQQAEEIARLVQVLNLTIDLDVATEVAKTRRRKK